MKTIVRGKCDCSLSKMENPTNRLVNMVDYPTILAITIESRVINIACKGCNLHVILEIICDAGANCPNSRLKFMYNLHLVNPKLHVFLWQF